MTLFQNTWSNLSVAFSTNIVSAAVLFSVLCVVIQERWTLFRKSGESTKSCHKSRKIKGLEMLRFVGRLTRK